MARNTMAQIIEEKIGLALRREMRESIQKENKGKHSEEK